MIKIQDLQKIFSGQSFSSKTRKPAIGKGGRERNCDVLINYLSHISPSLSDSIDLSPTYSYSRREECSVGKQSGNLHQCNRQSPWAAFQCLAPLVFFSTINVLLCSVPCVLKCSTLVQSVTNFIAFVCAHHVSLFHCFEPERFCIALYQDIVHYTVVETGKCIAVKTGSV